MPDGSTYIFGARMPDDERGWLQIRTFVTRTFGADVPAGMVRYHIGAADLYAEQFSSLMSRTYLKVRVSRNWLP
jgi:hypothetical protein